MLNSIKGIIVGLQILWSHILRITQDDILSQSPWEYLLLLVSINSDPIHRGIYDHINISLVGQNHC